MARLEFRIETERLIIRPFEMADIEASYEMNLDPEVVRYTADGGVVNKNEIERRIVEDVFGDYEKYGFGRWAVEWKAEKKFIGFAGLKYLADLDEVDIGFRFVRTYWGKGIATESGSACVEYGWTTLGLKRIIGWVLPQNVASIRVLEKLGFRFEKEFMEGRLKVKQYFLTKKPRENFGI